MCAEHALDNSLAPSFFFGGGGAKLNNTIQEEGCYMKCVKGFYFSKETVG